MAVFSRERMNGYYGIGTFVISNTIASAPFIFGIALLSSVTVSSIPTLPSFPSFPCVFRASDPHLHNLPFVRSIGSSISMMTATALSFS